LEQGGICEKDNTDLWFRIGFFALLVILIIVVVILIRKKSKSSKLATVQVAEPADPNMVPAPIANQPRPRFLPPIVSNNPQIAGRISSQTSHRNMMVSQRDPGNMPKIQNIQISHGFELSSTKSIITPY
jgi:hypothetical protein